MNKRALKVLILLFILGTSNSFADTIKIRNDKTPVQIASDNTQVIAILNAGAEVEKVSSSGKMYQISYQTKDGNKVEGWVKSGNVEGAELTAEQAGRIAATCALYLYNNRRNEFAYQGPRYETSGRKAAYEGKKTTSYLYGTSGHYPGKQTGPGKATKFFMDCGGFMNVVIHWSLGIGGETYHNFTSNDSPYTDRISAKELGADSSGRVTSKIISNLKPGDIIKYKGHYAMYVGDGKIAEMINYSKPSWSSWTLKYRGVTAYNGYSSFQYVVRLNEYAAQLIDYNTIPPEYIPDDLFN